MKKIKPLGKKPPESCMCGQFCPEQLNLMFHYRQSLIQAADELENKNVVFPDRISLSDWNENLARKLRISAGEIEVS